MKRIWPLFLILASGFVSPALPRTKGYLFIIGGGDRPESMMQRFVEMAGRFGNGKIVVFPMASSEPEETGAGLVSEFASLGARQVENLILTREQALSESSVHMLDGAGGVFFSGGDQSRQMAVLRQTPLHRRLLELYDQGCVMAGTSAGAAVMSEVMITGEERRKVEEGHEFETLEAANIVTSEGLGFIRTAIIDQHFVTRKRHNRLISLVAEKPFLLGIGIDEETAIIVSPDETFEVLGRKSVVVYDASRADTDVTSSGLIALRGVAMHVLVGGDRFDLKAREVVR
ncbi:MAG: cyanophycinase [Candidatus Aminicenantes bacterium]|nr:cyanophycinase [Candidatus Aminicenantes bacterium]